MGSEIERKFLVRDASVLDAHAGTYFKQGYVRTADKTTVRVRLAGEQGFLTLKGPTVGISRVEYEYEVPAADAKEMLAAFCSEPMIEKTRFKIEVDGLLWEVDRFMGQNEGLVLAEVELESEDQVVSPPSWVGQEVSGDARYFNSRLAENPFSRWGK